MFLTADSVVAPLWIDRHAGIPLPLGSPLCLPAPAQRPQPLAWASAASPQGRPELQDIVRGADQRPLTPHLSQPAQQELPEAAALLDLPEHQLHDGLAPSIQTPIRVSCGACAASGLPPVLQRRAYGYRDEDDLKLKIVAAFLPPLTRSEDKDLR